MNYYPEQLAAVTDLCKVLDEWEKRHEGAPVYFYVKDVVLYVEGGEQGEVFGRVEDEDGIGWSFEPAE